MYQLTFYVPESHVEQVKNALFAAGAGKVGRYDHCAWQTKGVGQFCPLEGSHPYQGEQQKIERVDEYKVEMVCEDWLVSQVVTALREHHPYEEPAFAVWRIEEF